MQYDSVRLVWLPSNSLLVSSFSILVLSSLGKKKQEVCHVYWSSSSSEKLSRDRGHMFKAGKNSFGDETQLLIINGD